MTSARFREAWDAARHHQRRLHPHHRAPPPRARSQELLQRVLRQRRHLLGHLRGPVLRGLRGVLHRETTWSTATCPIHDRPVERARARRTTSSSSPPSSDRLLDWYEAHPDVRAARGQAQRGARPHQAGPARTSRSAARRSSGASPVPWDPSTSSTCGSTRSSTTSPRSATAATASASTDWWPTATTSSARTSSASTRVLAGDAAGRRAGAAAAQSASTASCSWAARRCRKTSLNQIVPADLVGRLRRRRLPLPLPARQPLRSRRRLQLRGHGRPLQRRPGQQPRQPADPCGHRGGQEVRRRRARRRSARQPARRGGGRGLRRARPRPGTRVAALAGPRGHLAPHPRDQRPSRGQTEPWKAEPGPEVDARPRRRPRGAAHRDASWPRRPCPTPAPRSGGGSASPGAPEDQRLPEAAVWGGYPGGLAVEKGDPLFPGSRLTDGRTSPPALDRRPLPPRSPRPADGGAGGAAAAPRRPGVEPAHRRGHRRGRLERGGRSGRGATPRCWATAGVHPHDAERRHRRASRPCWPRPEVGGRGGVRPRLPLRPLAPRGPAGGRSPPRSRWPTRHDLAAGRSTPGRRGTTPSPSSRPRACPARTVFHCFTGGPDEAAAVPRPGCATSPSAASSPSRRRRRARRGRALPARPPAGRDRLRRTSPPCPHRGRPNQPGAGGPGGPEGGRGPRRRPLAAVAETTWANATRLYGLPD